MTLRQAKTKALAVKAVWAAQELNIVVQMATEKGMNLVSTRELPDGGHEFTFDMTPTRAVSSSYIGELMAHLKKAVRFEHTVRNYE